MKTDLVNDTVLPISIFVLQVGERIRVILDCEDNTLAFEKNYEFLGKFNRIVNFTSF